MTSYACSSVVSGEYSIEKNYLNCRCNCPISAFLDLKNGALTFWALTLTVSKCFFTDCFQTGGTSCTPCRKGFVSYHTGSTSADSCLELPAGTHCWIITNDTASTAVGSHTDASTGVGSHADASTGVGSHTDASTGVGSHTDASTGVGSHTDARIFEESYKTCAYDASCVGVKCKRETDEELCVIGGIVGAVVNDNICRYPKHQA